MNFNAKTDTDSDGVLVLKQFDEQFVGSSFTVRIHTTSGLTCALKMRGTGNGARSLVAEFIVNRVAAIAGWNVPDVFPVRIPEGFPWEFGTDEFDDLLQKSFGLNLGIVFLPDVVSLRNSGLDILPRQMMQRMTALDALFCNYDRQAISGNVLKDGSGNCWMIDHGSCLFIDQAFCAMPIELPSNHMFKSRERELLSLPTLREIGQTTFAERAVGEVPAEWLEEAGLSRASVLNDLRERIGRLN